MDFAPMEAVSQREVLTAAELRSALEGLHSIDLIRLKKKANVLAPGTGMEPNDLLQEAVKRSLEENSGRNCPGNVKPAIFLGNVMKSIASHAREKRKREPPINLSKDDEDDPTANVPDPRPSPEEVVIRRLDCEKAHTRIEAMFNEDRKAQAIVIGIMEDWSPHEIREMETMSKKEYEAARKRVRRKLLREAPKGLTHE